MIEVKPGSSPSGNKEWCALVGSIPDPLDVTLRVRAEGYQYANDLNTFRLPGHATMDLFVARGLRELVNHLKVFVAVTNLFDKQIITGKNQTVTNIGATLTM